MPDHLEYKISDVANLQGAAPGDQWPGKAQPWLWVLGLCALDSREGSAGLQSSAAAAGGAGIATSAAELMLSSC